MCFGKVVVLCLSGELLCCGFRGKTVERVCEFYCEFWGENVAAFGEIVVVSFGERVALIGHRTLLMLLIISQIQQQ